MGIGIENLQTALMMHYNTVDRMEETNLIRDLDGTRDAIFCMSRVCRDRASQTERTPVIWEYQTKVTKRGQD